MQQASKRVTGTAMIAAFILSVLAILTLDETSLFSPLSEMRISTRSTRRIATVSSSFERFTQLRGKIERVPVEFQKLAGPPPKEICNEVPTGSDPSKTKKVCFKVPDYAAMAKETLPPQADAVMDEVPAGSVNVSETRASFKSAMLWKFALPWTFTIQQSTK
jgi:hypothetical protein